MLEVLSFLAFAALVTFGAIVRTTLSIYKGYDTFAAFRPEWKRVLFEIVASILFGTFGVYVLDELHVFNFSSNIIAVLAGLLGPDTIKLITKKIGMTSSSMAVVSKQQLAKPGLSPRQINSLQVARKTGRITNRVHQQINHVSHRSAAWDLKQLVDKGVLVQRGSGRSSYYVPKNVQELNSRK